MKPGALLVVAACLCWAVDNNLTRKISTHDAMLIAFPKGLVAGLTNTSLTLVSGATWPKAAIVTSALSVGFVGYGVSLSLFVLALRTLGTARAGAYFSTAPLLGVVLAFGIWPEVPTATFWGAAAHAHVHDEHHQHAHDFEWDRSEPHHHAHRTPEVTHRHGHFPDVHHRHPHPH